MNFGRSILVRKKKNKEVDKIVWSDEDENFEPNSFSGCLKDVSFVNKANMSAKRRKKRKQFTTSKFQKKKAINFSNNLSYDVEIDNSSSDELTVMSNNDSILKQECFASAEALENNILRIPYNFDNNVHSSNDKENTQFRLGESNCCIASGSNLHSNFSGFSSKICSQSSNNECMVGSDHPTELDLLISLIETQNRTQSVIINRSPGPKLKKKKYLKGGYLEHLQQTLVENETNQKYLQDDIKFCVTDAQIFDVLKLESAFGTYKATVADRKGYVFGLILNACMARNVKVGFTKLEAFFDNDIEAYKLRINGELVYVQPHKLFLLNK